MTCQRTLPHSFSGSRLSRVSRWQDFPAAVLLLCCQAGEVSGPSSEALLLRTVTEWAPHHLTGPLTMRRRSGTTPLTFTHSTAACSPSACRAEEGKQAREKHSLLIGRFDARSSSCCVCAGTAGPGWTGAAETPTAT